MVKLLIIADDLTGALDSAAPFAMRGLKTLVARRPGFLDRAFAESPDILAVSTASREIDARSAAAKVTSVVEAASRAGLTAPDRIFKKVDSRLKGNVGAEARIVAELSGAGRVIVCPAVPEQGRWVEDGNLVGRGVAAPIPVIDCFSADGVHVDVPDAREKRDLLQIVKHAKPRSLLIGAAGLATALAEQISGRFSADVGRLSLDAPALLVVGSRDPVTLEQLNNLRGRFDGAWIEAPNGQSTASLSSGSPLTVVQMMPAAEQIDGKEAAANFSETVCRLLNPMIRSLVCCGGETADAVLSALGVGLIELDGELLPGVPRGVIRIGDKKMLIATKSGGFGSANCLADIVKPLIIENFMS